MKLFGKDLSKDILYVAEIGNNHQGGFDYARELLKLAAEAGADAVKFQSFTPERFISSSTPERLERITKFALDEDQHKTLFEDAKKLGVKMFSSLISEDWVDKLGPHVEAYKIASGDITFKKVIQDAAKTGKPLIISTGAATVEEIDQAVSWVEEIVGKDKLPERLAVLHCICAYPTPLDQANVRSVVALQERYPTLTIGYSNHVIEPEATYAAIALGARIVEVHFTDNKKDRDFHDHTLSFEPQEFKELVRMGNQINQSLGRFEKTIQECELDPQIVRKGILVSKDLTEGHVLSAEDLMFGRPATDFPANDVDQVVGKKLTKALKKGEVLAKDAVA